MMETVNGTGKLSCEEAACLMENTVAGEELSASEQKRLSVHLDDCSQCRGIHSALQSLHVFDEILVNADIDPVIQTVLDDLDADDRSHRMKKRLMVFSAVGAVLVTMLLAWQWFTDGATRSPNEKKLAICLPDRPTQLASGVFVAGYQGTRWDVRIGEGEVRVILGSGSLALSVDPERQFQRAVVVETPDGEVRVKGTVFAVHVSDSEHSRVEVVRGVVEMVMGNDTERRRSNGGQLSPGLLVKSGHGATMDGGTSYPLTTVEAKRLFDRLSAQTPNAANNTKNDSIDGSVRISQNGSKKPESDVEIRDDSNSEAAPSAPSGATVDHGVSRKTNTESIDTLIDSARSKLLAHDWRSAAQTYRMVLKRFPGHRETMAVLISLAKLELRYLHQPEQALGHYKSYLKKTPRGNLAEDALHGTAQCYRALGHKHDEVTALQLFVKSYPHSPMLDRAKRRLSEIGANPNY